MHWARAGFTAAAAAAAQQQRSRLWWLANSDPAALALPLRGAARHCRSSAALPGAAVEAGQCCHASLLLLRLLIAATAAAPMAGPEERGSSSSGEEAVQAVGEAVPLGVAPLHRHWLSKTLSCLYEPLLTEPPGKGQGSG